MPDRESGRYPVFFVAFVNIVGIECWRVFCCYREAEGDA